MPRWSPPCIQTLASAEDVMQVDGRKSLHRDWKLSSAVHMGLMVFVVTENVRYRSCPTRWRGVSLFSNGG